MKEVGVLNSLGLNCINYILYYLGCHLHKSYDIAITPGEPHLVPASVKRTTDIKIRQFVKYTFDSILYKFTSMEESIALAKNLEE